MFEPLTREERNDLVRRTHVRGLHTREILFRQGDAAGHTYMVAKGQVKLSKITSQGDQVIVAIVTPGLLFAVVSLMKTTTYPVSAEANVPSEVLCWPKDEMAPIVSRHPEIAIQAVRIISERMFDLQDRYRDLATLPVPQRLARTLVRLERQREESRLSSLRLSRQDLAEMIGSTLFTVSRILTAWSEKGIVETARESVTVRDLARLERLCNPDE